MKFHTLQRPFAALLGISFVVILLAPVAEAARRSRGTPPPPVIFTPKPVTSSPNAR